MSKPSDSTSADRNPAHGAPWNLRWVRLAALWILLGAAFKLGWGTPNDLPAPVKDFGREALGLSASATYRLAIAIELSIALPALWMPTRLWPLVAAQLAVFCAVLIPLVASGAEHCGCFGSKVPMPPWGMLVIDGSMLAVLLLLRPWRARSGARVRWLPLAASLAAAWLLPYRTVPSGKFPAAGNDSSQQTASAGPSNGASPAGSPDSGPSAGTNGDPNGAASAAPGKVSEARALPRFIEWTPTDWVDQRLSESGMAPFVAVDNYSQDATWIVYSPTCDHCAAYLRRLESAFATDPKVYVFVRLPGDSGAARAVDAMPPGEEVELPGSTEYVITPPWSLDVQGGVIRSAFHPEDV